MAHPFEEYLIQEGYVPHKCLVVSSNIIHVPIDRDKFGYSSMGGNLDLRYIKGELEVIFGLHEKDKPPTLISPRPHRLLMQELKYVFNETSIMPSEDDLMNRVLSNYAPAIIYSLLWPKPSHA